MNQGQADLGIPAVGMVLGRTSFQQLPRLLVILHIQEQPQAANRRLGSCSRPSTTTRPPSSPAARGHFAVGVAFFGISRRAALSRDGR
mmetsp:Transcript_97703/g.260832  ORF Transcript_97703/g.260832 Transcript_97703/m.260832 type:complete len:88 (-) Transcript_97703:86-349(-)